MLKKDSRIGKNKEFDRAFKLGQSFYGKFLSIKVVDNNLGRLRLGVLVSTKVSKKATVRNLIKRRVRNALRQSVISLRDGKDVVVVVFPLILDKNFQEIKTTIKDMLNKAGVLVKNND